MIDAYDGKPEHAGIEEMAEGSDDIDREAVQVGKAIMQDKAIAEAQSNIEKALDNMEVNND